MTKSVKAGGHGDQTVTTKEVKMSEHKIQSTRYQGVYSRTSTTRIHNGRADICYFADYYTNDASTGKKKRVRKLIGWLSEGITAVYAHKARAKLMTTDRASTERGNFIAEATPITLSTAFEKYRNEWLIARGKKDTGDACMFYKNLSPWLHVNLHEITPYMLDSMITAMTQNGLSPQSTCYVIGIIKRTMRRMEAWGFYQGQMPFGKITLPKVNNSRQRFLTPIEAQTLLAALHKKSLTVYTQTLISLHCGLRFGEIAALTFEDIDFYTHTIIVRDSKSGKSRQAVMTGHLESELRTYITACPPKALLFVGEGDKPQKCVSKTFGRTVTELGFNTTANQTPITDRRQKVVFHSMRHTYASWLAMTGQGQSMIADLLGHASLEMSARYTHLFPDARRSTAGAIENIFFNHES